MGSRCGHYHLVLALADTFFNVYVCHEACIIRVACKVKPESRSGPQKFHIRTEPSIEKRPQEGCTRLRISTEQY
jgi:hypothetical protein